MRPVGPLLPAALLILALANPRDGRGDYNSDPSLRPSWRCQNLPGGATDPDCQPLFWDLPATAAGQTAWDTPVRGYPNGVTDRPPPLYIDAAGNGYERPGSGRQPLCGPFEVPTWEATGQTRSAGGRIEHEYRVVCRRGTRVTFGPWSFGDGSKATDRVWSGVLRIDNQARLADDQAAGRIPPNARREWFTGIEIYNHAGSHHVNLWDPVHECNDPDDPAYAASNDCSEYRQSDGGSTRQWRAATQFTGRFEVALPPGKALPILEGQLWPAEQHSVSRLFFDGAHRDFNRQTGGAVGEFIVQVFTEPFSRTDLERISVLFDALTSVATLVIPPFTVAPNLGVWYAPFDLEIALLTTHSHKRTVRSWVDVVPANPVRPNDPDPRCGGSAGREPAMHVYENRAWDDANVCRYWESPDGTLVLRKGQALLFGCLFNNGVRHTKEIPDPLLRSLVESSPVAEEFLYGEQARDNYRVKYGCEQRVFTSGTVLYDGPVVGPEWLPPLPFTAPSQPCDPPPGDEDHPYENPVQCSKNDFLYGSRRTGRCVPASLVFADHAEDEMCILAGFYWPLERALDVDADVNVRDRGLSADAVEIGPKPLELDPGAGGGDPTRLGTPGRLPQSPSDFGKCEGCSKLLPRLVSP